MRTRFFLVLMISFLFTINFVVAENCTIVGEIKIGQYCGADGILHNLKNDGGGCLNNYECLNQSCVENICDSKYGSFFEQQSVIDEILDFISGVECEPGDESCSRTDYLMCGANSVWENKGKVNGKCDYSTSSGSSGSSGGDDINIVIYSPQNVTYSNTQILLDVRDSEKNTESWWYSLNGAEKVKFDGSETITARQGSNSLIVYASETSYFYDEKKEIVFSVMTLTSSYCGNKICDSGENCDNCPRDCGNCVIDLSCGDGVCDSDESSYTCPDDCEAEEPTSYLWLFILVVILIIGAIVFVGFKFYKKVKGLKKEEPVHHKPAEHPAPTTQLRRMPPRRFVKR